MCGPDITDQSRGMSQKQPLELRFVADEDVLDHIVEKRRDIKAADGSVQTLVTLKAQQRSRRAEDEEEEEEEVLSEQSYVQMCVFMNIKAADGSVQTLVTLKAQQRSRRAEDEEEEEEEEEVLSEQSYVHALCTGSQDTSENGTVTAGSSVFSFQTIKRGNKMAQMASEWSRTPGKSVTFCTSDTNEDSSSPTRTAQKSANQSKTPQKGKKVQFISTTPHRLRKRLSAPNLRSDSESDFSPSNSEDDDDAEEHEGKRVDQPKTPSKNTSAAALYKTPSKKGKKAAEVRTCFLHLKHLSNHPQHPSNL
ncbi:origin recognition complex subunit 2-like, partial [Sinocyclocheilus grahami]|uniref:origin recognition complex subunit 2-like n=1 Tax=Sinocyclocheilus grahami TaxID=75366 RepID=UPI0007ACD349